MRLTKIKNWIIQGVAVAGVFYTHLGPYIPAQYKNAASLGITITQAIVGIIAHKKNEDGTPQEVPFSPPPDIFPQKKD